MIVKKLLKTLVILTSALLVLVLAAVIGIRFFLETGTAGRLIQDRINAAIPGHISWQDQSLSFFAGKVAVNQIRIAGPENDAIITADQLAVDIGLTDLLNRELVIRTVRLDRPGVFLETGAHGQLNLIRAFAGPNGQPSSKPEPEGESDGSVFNIRINELILTQGCFTYKTASAHSMTRSEHLKLENIGIFLADADLGERSGSLDIEIAGGNVDMAGIRTPIRRVRLSTVLAGDRLDPLEMELGTADSRIRLSGAVARIFDKPTLDVRLSLASDLADIRQILNLDTALSGPIQLELTVAGSLENPDATLKLNYDGGVLADMEIQAIDLETRLQDRTLIIDRLNAVAAGGKLEASGHADLQAAFADGFFSEPTDLSAIAYQLDLNAADARLSDIPGMPTMSGNLTGSIHLTGRGISPETLTAEADVDIQGKRITVDKKVPPLDLRMAVRTRWEKGRLAFDPLTLATSDAVLDISGAYDVSESRLNLSADAKIPDLETLLAPLGISGVYGKNVKLTADISGPVAQPEATALIHTTHLAFRDVAIGDLTAAIGFADGILRISSLDLQNNESKMSLTGSLRVLDKDTRQPVADPDVDLALRAAPIFLQDFVSGISGQLTVNADIRGSLHHPSGTLAIESGRLDLGVQTLSGVHLTSRIDDQQIFIDPLEFFTAPDQGIRAHGWISLDQAYELQINSDLIDIKTINRLAETDFGGRIHLSFQGAGRFDDPQIEGQVAVSGMTAGQKSLPDMKINVALADQTVCLDTKDPFAVNAVYDLTGQDFSATAELAGAELAPFFQIAGRKDISGQMSGTLTANGNAKNPEQTQLRLRISDLIVLQKDTELIRTQGFAADLENGSLSIPGSRITFLGEGYADIRGTAQASAALDGNLDISADGYIPATLITALVPGIDQAEGRISVVAKIKGPIKQPDMSGNIVFESVGLTMIDTLQKLHDMNGQIGITGKAITVSGLRGRLDAGKFGLDGTIEIDHFQPVQANLKFFAQALPVEIEDLLEITINSDLTLSGIPDKSSLSGRMELLEGHYYKDVNLSLVDTAGKIGERKRQTAPRKDKPGIDLPFLKNLSLDVALISRNPFIVDNNLALMSIIPALRIHGNINNPLVSGRAQATEGTITYRDTEFEVKKGVVDFVNPYRIEPAVDIRAESRIRHWVVTLAISGTPENLEFKFSSNPPEADADILSLLLVGKTTRELAEGSGSDSQSPEEMLANLVAGKLAGQIKEETGLDIVELEYRKNGSEAHSADEVKVTVGKELSRRLTVKYGVENKGGIVVQQSTAIYKLFEHLSVNAFQDTEGDFGGEMRYRLEFR